jgi:hypothetical protein
MATLRARIEALTARIANEFKQVRLAIADRATLAQVDERIAGIVGGAPAAFDTLQEIAAQLSSDPAASSALVAGQASLRADLDSLTQAIGETDTDFAALFNGALIS